MPEIPLGNTVFATVDEMDSVAVCLAGSWHLNKYGYAQRNFCISYKKYKCVLLHQFIAQRMGLNCEVDHKDRDKLNCRRENLRPATASEQQANKNARNATGYKGVVKVPKGFRANIGSEATYLGIFNTAEQAARAYDTAAREKYGEFAVLNFPEQF